MLPVEDMHLLVLTKRDHRPLEEKAVAMVNISRSSGTQ